MAFVPPASNTQQNMKKTLSIFALIILMLTFTSCAAPITQIPQNQRLSSPKLDIVASFYPLEFFAKEIAGDKANVSTLIPIGAEPHDYELLPDDIKKLQNSDLILVLGANLEPWAEQIYTFELLGDTNDETVNVLSFAHTLESLKNTETPNPHIWLDPVLAQEMTVAITAQLSEIDPNNSTYYTKRTNELNAQLQSLDEEFRTGLQDCEHKKFVVSHDAFTYLASRYGLETYSITGLTPNTEPSIERIKEIVDYLKTSGDEYIFLDAFENPEAAQVIVDESGLAALTLRTIEGITEEEQILGIDYFSLMRSNLENLKKGLSCQ